MALEQKLDLVSPKPQQDWMSPGQRKIFGGMSREVSSAFSPGQKQLGQQAVNFLTTPIVAPTPVAPAPRPQVSENDRMLGLPTKPVSDGRYAPDQLVERPARMVKEIVQHSPVPTEWNTLPDGNTRVTGGYTPNDTTRDVRLNPGMDTRVNLGGGNYIQAPQGTISPEQSLGMKTAAAPSTPEALASRAESAAMADQRYADWRAQKAQGGGGMPASGGMPQSGQRDYSEAIDRALAVLEKPRPSGDIDRQIAWKNEVSAAKQTLGLLGGMQTAEGQQATTRGIAAMGDQTERYKADMANKTAQERTAAEQEQERQRTAFGMASLTSQDQERLSRMGLDKARFDREGQIAEQGAQQTDAARQAYFNQLKSEGSGIIFDDEQKLQDAEAVRSGIISPAELFKLRNKS